MVNVRKRGKVYEYSFDVAKIEGKRKRITKSGFKTKAEALKQGTIAYNEYLNTGRNIKINEMSYSDFLDYWLDNHCKINLKYHTIEAYSNIVKNHLKPNLGFYKLSQITKTTLQDFLNKVYVEKGYSKNFLNNIRKVLKCSFNYATDNEYVKANPALNLTLPKYDVPPNDPAHIFTNEEINLILDRFKNNHCVYYAFLTAYCTGLRASEVFALTWNDIDFRNKTISVNKNILKKNQAGGTKNRHLSGNSTTVWYFGTCKTETKIVNAYSEIDVALEEVDFVFVKKKGVYEGTDSPKYPFKVIHYELGIPCRFHDFRDIHATKLIESGADIKSVSKRLGHRNIDITYNIYVRVTEKMEKETADKFETICKFL